MIEVASCQDGTLPHNTLQLPVWRRTRRVAAAAIPFAFCPLADVADPVGGAGSGILKRIGAVPLKPVGGSRYEGACHSQRLPSGAAVDVTLFIYIMILLAGAVTHLEVYRRRLAMRVQV